MQFGANIILELLHKWIRPQLRDLLIAADLHHKFNQVRSFYSFHCVGNSQYLGDRIDKNFGTDTVPAGDLSQLYLELLLVNQQNLGPDIIESFHDVCREFQRLRHLIVVQIVLFGQFIFGLCQLFVPSEYRHFNGCFEMLVDLAHSHPLK